MRNFLFDALRSYAALRHGAAGLVGAAIIVLWVLAAVFAPLLASFDPQAIHSPFNIPLSRQPFALGGRHWLGTDQIGRDIFARIVWGARPILSFSALTTIAAYVLATAAGVVAGIRRGKTEKYLFGVIGVVLSLPVLVLAVAAAAWSAASASGHYIILALAFASVPWAMRAVRGLVVELKESSDAEPLGPRLGLGLLGAGGVLAADAAARMAYISFTIAALGFIGLGVATSDPEWGRMIGEARREFLAYPYMVISPAVALVSLVAGFVVVEYERKK